MASVTANLPTPAEPTQHLTLTMMGGAMGGRHDGDNIWAFNNVSDLQADPFGSFKNGETVRITFANDTSFPHGIHLHGHHFYEVDQNGALGDLRDTTLVNAGDSRDIICVFDNPGRWLIALPHAQPRCWRDAHMGERSMKWLLSQSCCRWPPQPLLITTGNIATSLQVKACTQTTAHRATGPTLRDSRTGNPRTPMVCFQPRRMIGRVTHGITMMNCCSNTPSWVALLH